MDEFARKKHDLVVLGNNGSVAAVSDVLGLFEARIVQPEFAAVKWTWRTVKVIDESDFPCREFPASGIVVRAEEVTIAASGNLHVEVRHFERHTPKASQYVRELRPNGLNNRLRVSR